MIWSGIFNAIWPDTAHLARRRLDDEGDDARAVALTRITDVEQWLAEADELDIEETWDGERWR